jgi:hypothetical protein
MRAAANQMFAVDGEQPGARKVRSAHYDVLTRATNLIFAHGTQGTIEDNAGNGQAHDR